MIRKLEVLEKIEDQKGFLEVYLDLKGEIEFPNWINEYKNVLKIAFLSDSRKFLAETPDPDSIRDMQANAKHILTSNMRGDGYITILVPLYVNEFFMGDLIFWFSDSDLRIEEKQALLLVGWILIFSMLFGSLLAWIISSAITKPINQLTLDTKSITTGNIDHKIYHLKSMDEIGALARSFHSMRDSIREKLNEVNEKNLALLNEINERKQAENQLTKFATVIEQADEEVLITDPEGTIQYVNPSFEKNTGYTKNDVLGQRPSILKSGIHNSEFYKDLWKTIFDKKIWKGTIHNKCKNDQLILHDMTITPILDSNKEISAFVSIRRDITDKAKIEQQMIHSQKMEAMGTLAGGIAHDFNNILSGIFGYANLAESNLDNPEKAKNQIGQITKGATRATELVQQILTFSRQTEYKKSSIKLYLIIKEVINFLRSSIPSNVEIKEKIISRAAVLADPTQI
ncbi:MAG: PAS domain S-box protein, partial [Bacteroidetes bacterium]|nr:PAS domain S-box protein [Bacteroidota bacterium]